MISTLAIKIILYFTKHDIYVQKLHAKRFDQYQWYKLLSKRQSWCINTQAKPLYCKHVFVLKSNLSFKIKHIVYYAISKPVLTYGIPLWSSASKSNIICLQRAQNNIKMAYHSADAIVLKILHQHHGMLEITKSTSI